MVKKSQSKIPCRRFYVQIIMAVVGLIIFSISAQSNAACPQPRQTWFVEAGAPDNGDGSKKNPLNSGQQITDCTAAGNNIFIVPSADLLTGEIVLKPNQRLLGQGANVFNSAAESDLPRLGLQSGAGIKLAEYVTVQNLVIEEVGEPIAPFGTALVDGQLSQGGVTLKQLKVSKSQDFSGAGAINLDLDGADTLSPITLQQVSVETEVDFTAADISSWFGIGVRVALAGVSGACDAQTMALTLQNVTVKNSRSSIGVFQFCSGGTNLAVNASDVHVVNGDGDHFLLFNQGSLDADIDGYVSINEPLARDVLVQSSFSPALIAGANFGLEYFGFPSAGPSRVKVRNSSITRSTGNGVGILQFALADPVAPTNLVLDFGCIDYDCEQRGLEESAGNNSIFDNVAGRGNPLGNDYASYLLSPFGVSLLFPFPVNIDPSIANNIGNALNLYVDAPGDVQFVGQGNYWGDGISSLGTCAEIGVGFGPGGAALSQANSGDFSANNQWNCSLWNTFTFSNFPAQPETAYGLAYNPN